MLYHKIKIDPSAIDISRAFFLSFLNVKLWIIMEGSRGWRVWVDCFSHFLSRCLFYKGLVELYMNVPRNQESLNSSEESKLDK